MVNRNVLKSQGFNKVKKPFFRHWAYYGRMHISPDTHERILARPWRSAIFFAMFFYPRMIGIEEVLLSVFFPQIAQPSEV
jgi:hypothetical protein